MQLGSRFSGLSKRKTEERIKIAAKLWMEHRLCLLLYQVLQYKTTEPAPSNSRTAEFVGMQ